MAIDIATLGVRVDASGAVDGLNKVEGAIGKLKGAAAALGIVLGAGTFAAVIKNSIESQYAMAQLEARVKSTGMAAGFTAKQLDEMSVAMARQSIYSDEAVKQAQSLLLTFTKIKGETFPQATQAVMNLATAMGGDLKGAALQVGKALQDPEQGLTALRRSGVSFTDAQQDVIKTLFATGEQAKAQALILKELEVEFGGAAAAARNTLGGALTALKEEFGNVWEVSRESSAGIVSSINAITRALPRLRDMIVAFIGGVRLLWVDLQVGIQKFNAAFYDGIAAIASGAARLLSFLPGTTDEVRELEAAAAGLRTKADILRDSMEAWRREQEALITGTGAQTTAVRAQTVETERLATAQAKVRAALPAGPGTQGGFAALPGVDLGGSLGGAYRAVQAKMTADARAEGEKRAAVVLGIELDNIKDRQQIEENFLRGLQESFARTFENIFTKGVSSFRDLFQSLGDLIKQAAAQLAASGLMDFLTSNYKKGGGGLGGIAAIAGAIPGVGWIAGGLAAIGGLISSHHKAAEAAKRQSEENIRLTIEHQKAADAAAAQAAAEAAKREVERKFNEDMGLSALRVNELRRNGMNDEADALELFNRQVREFQDAVRNGWSTEALAALSRDQEAQRTAQAAKAAADAQAQYNDAIREGERLMREGADAIAAAWDKAAEHSRGLADASESLAVRMARAQGNMAEADRMAFQLQQRQELRAAEADVRAIQREMRDLGIGRSFYNGVQDLGGGYAAPTIDPYWYEKYGANAAIGYQTAQAQLPAYLQMIAEQMSYIEQLKAVQAAESVAFTNGASMPGASAAVPGTAGSFNTIVSRATSAQGDRMLDELTTSRTLQQMYLPYLKTIAERLSGGVNALLGSSLQADLALAGNATVS